MLKKYFLISSLTLLISLFSTPSFSQTPGAVLEITINTSQSISGKPLIIKSVSGISPFTASKADDYQFLIHFPSGPFWAGAIANFVIAPEGNNSQYSCSIQVIAYPAQEGVGFEPDSKHCSGIFLAGFDMNACGPRKICYFVNFYTYDLEKK